MGFRKDIDWEKAERLYRLGKKSDVEIAAILGISRSAIVRKAKKEQWEKDLTEAVTLETKLQVRANIVREATEELHTKLQCGFVKDMTAVEIEAFSNSMMLSAHEKAGTKGRQLFESILEKLDEQVQSTPTIEELKKLAESSEELEGLAAGLRKVLSLPSYVDSAKKAVEGLAKSIETERKARGLDDKEAGGGNGIEDVLDGIWQRVQG